MVHQGREVPEIFDTIEYEGGLWIVPHWVDTPILGLTLRYRISRIDQLLGAQVTTDELLRPSEFADVDNEFAFPLPAAVLEFGFPLGDIKGLVMIERPDLVFRGGHGVN